jgi:hypothetical protein
MQKNRMFLNPGSFAAALTCLVLAACGGPSPSDSGMMPDPDAYMAMDDGGMPMDDAYVPDHDSGMPDVDAGMDAGEMGTCTSDMMVNRVSPPCDPDNNPDFGPGIGPTGLEGLVSGPGHVGPTWNTATSSFEIYQSSDSMGRTWIAVPCGECSIVPDTNRFYFSADGVFYVNWVNRHVPGVQGNHARITFSADHMTATLEVFDGGSDTPSMTVTLWVT